ncbi:MAG: TIGR02678 family protein [Chloroflexota bacterium]
MSGAATRVRPAVASRAVTPAEREIELRRAIRALLAEPLLIAEQADADTWAAVRRHIPELRAWFAEHTGWQLSVDARIGVARLRKQPGWDNADATRPAIAPGASRRPFDRRRYVLFCLACAELDRTASAQTLLSTLAEQIKVRSATEGLVPFDADVYAERFALVDALRLLERQGVLALNDGDEDRFVAGAGDALYTIDRDRLSRLVATPRVPSVAGGIEELVRESYPDSREGRARRSRHVLMRRLLDDPVVYESELDPETRAYLRTQRAALSGWLRDAGLELERREEGAAAIDAGEDLADTPFPSSGTVAHATLLACELLAARGREGAGPGERVSDDELTAFFAVLLEQHGRHWAGSVRDAGPEALRDQVVERLASFRLVRRVPGGVNPLPAVGRFRSPELNALADAQAQLGLTFPEVS